MVTGPVMAADWLNVADRIVTMWERQGTPNFNWACSEATPVTSTVLGKNILSGSTAGYSATEAGFYIWTAGRGRISSPTSPVECWVYASASSGTDTATFYYSAGAIAQVNITGAAGWYTATGSFNTTGITDPELVTVEIGNGGSGTVTLYAAGMMDYQA
jgi:hypothetical protein